MNLNFYKIFSLILVAILLQSCSENVQKGEWIISSNDIRVFVPLDFSDRNDKSSLTCLSAGDLEEVDIPLAPFEITYKIKENGEKVIMSNLQMPTIISLDSLYYTNEDGSFSIIAGNVNNKEINGYAWRFNFSKDSILNKIECGDFKKNQLSKGQLYELNPKTYQADIYIGSFIKNRLHMGIHQSFFRDSIGEKIIGVWNNRKLNPIYEKLARQNYQICKKAGFGEEEITEEEVNFAHRYFFWLHYKWLFFIGFAIIGCLFVLCGIGAGMEPSDQMEAKKRKADRYKLKPWSKWGAYWRWFVFGLLRIDRYYLRHYIEFYLENVLLWVTIVASSKFIILYGLKPKLWIYLFPLIFNYWQGYLFLICVIFWVISIVTIPFDVYKINFKTYRHNIYEDLIIKNLKADYVFLYRKIPKDVQIDEPIIKNISEAAQIEYSNEQGFLSRSFSFITNSKVRHARKKADILNEYLIELSKIANKHNKNLKALSTFLDIERKNAYRNMLLAKELIFLIKNGKSNQRDFIKDKIGSLNIDCPDSYDVPDASLPELDFQNSFISGFNSFDSTFSTLKELGFEDKDNLLVSLGIGTIEAAIDGISQINSRRTLERQHYESQSSYLIQEIKRIDGSLVTIHAKMLRANEIMIALSAANEAFVKAYTPLRDQVFGKEVSIGGFINYVFKRHKKNARNLTERIAYLIAICNEYNKINISKIK